MRSCHASRSEAQAEGQCVKASIIRSPTKRCRHRRTLPHIMAAVHPGALPLSAPETATTPHPIARLPSELLELIFTHFPLRPLLNVVSLVCKLWRTTVLPIHNFVTADRVSPRQLDPRSNVSIAHKAILTRLRMCRLDCAGFPCQRRTEVAAVGPSASPIETS